MAWEILLGAALEASLSLLAEAGLGDEARALKDRLTKRTEKQRRKALEAAFQQAAEAVDDTALRPLLEHPPFQEAVVTGLLDPMSGFDLRAAVADWEERLPSSYVPSLRRFFNTLEGILLTDDTWGPILNRYQALRFQDDVLETLREQGLDVSPHSLVSKVTAVLEGSGAVAQGTGAVAAGEQGIAVGGDVDRIVQIIIQELIVERGGLPPTGPQPGDLRQRYLVELAREANRLPWTIVEQEYAHPERGQGLGLAEVYTALDTTELEQIEREEDLRHFLAQVERGEARRIPAQAMVNQQNRLVILGDPGSGKSTFVNHLAYTLAQANLAEDPEPWLDRMTPWDHGSLLPVRVELRLLAGDVGEERRGNASLLLGYLRRTLADWHLEGFWAVLETAIREEGQPLLVLLDGLDEVPAERRKVVVETVQDFADRYQHHRYVVTCRPYAYVGQPCQLQRFREVTLAPFDEDQIDHFVSTWYRELSRRERLSPREAEEQASRLQRVVRRRDLRGLARRPLLLTVMTLLHTFRGQLPEDRTEVYADAVDLLLRRWESRVGGEEGVLERLEIPGLKMSDLEAGLYEVAFHAHTGTEAEGTADIGEADLRKWLAPYLGGDWNQAGTFVDYIRERAGLLVRHKTEAYTFPHRSFQEFMAACHLVGMGDYPRQSARLVREDLSRWREVFVLAAGHAARTHRLGQAISAVNALCPRSVDEVREPDGVTFHQAQLAGEALLEIGLVGVRREEAGRAALERAQGWMVAAMRAVDALQARERAEAGGVLAQLGDPRPGVGLREDGLPDIAWCEVPAGSFLMGDEREPNETITRPYRISRYPVTNAQYSAFTSAGGYEEQRYWTQAGWTWRRQESVDGPWELGTPRSLPNHPIVAVSWYEAVAFCRWLTEQLRKVELLENDAEIVLPSEPEWEKAARGTDGRSYPWGDEQDPERANYGETGIGTTSAVGCFPGGASPYGVEDLSGNVWEWTRSLYASYPYDPEDGREDLNSTDRRVLRGGSFSDDATFVRCAIRYRDNSDCQWDLSGFRVVASPVRSDL